ncbi:MAG: hypothetical protein JWM77_4280 [Rhodospirillales bacterium]|nr:hypothetical protein [Rhodospirillales bacterium]
MIPSRPGSFVPFLAAAAGQVPEADGGRQPADDVLASHAHPLFTVAQAPVLDIVRLRLMAGDVVDREFLMQLAAAFREDCERSLEVMARALADQNSAQFWEAAHALSSAAVQTGAMRLSAYIRGAGQDTTDFPADAAELLRQARAEMFAALRAVDDVRDERTGTA